MVALQITSYFMIVLYIYIQLSITHLAVQVLVQIHSCIVTFQKPWNSLPENTVLTNSVSTCILQL